MGFVWVLLNQFNLCRIKVLISCKKTKKISDWLDFSNFHQISTDCIFILLFWKMCHEKQGTQCDPNHRLKRSKHSHIHLSTLPFTLIMLMNHIITKWHTWVGHFSPFSNQKKSESFSLSLSQQMSYVLKNNINWISLLSSYKFQGCIVYHLFNKKLRTIGSIWNSKRYLWE